MDRCSGTLNRRFKTIGMLGLVALLGVAVRAGRGLGGGGHEHELEAHRRRAES